MKAILQTVFLALAVMALSVPADAGPFALVELMMMREARGWRGGAVISSQPEPNRPAWLGTFFLPRNWENVFAMQNAGKCIDIKVMQNARAQTKLGVVLRSRCIWKKANSPSVKKMGPDHPALPR